MKIMRDQHLEKGVDYEWCNYRHMYSRGGVEKVCGIMGVVAPDGVESNPVVDTVYKPVVSVVSVPDELTVSIERLCPNPTWVMCRVAGKLEQVRVRNNRILDRGKRVKIRNVGFHWQVVGVRG